MIIREMNELDIDGVAEIEDQVFSTPWSRGAFEIELRDNKLAKYFVIEDEGYLVAYGGIWLIIDEGHITNIAVRDGYRGRGLGNLIVEALILYCDFQNIKRMTLEVRKSNIVAQNLYKKYGFISMGIRPKYYGDNNEDAVIMWRKN